MRRLPALSRAPLLAVILLALAAIAMGHGVAAPVPQSAEPACFPETGYCTGGRIREVWERGGGLMVFGFPITSLQDALIEGQVRQVQWFERARIELHPGQPYPYDVQVGRVGAELMGVHSGSYARTAIPGECRHFAETGRSLCGEFLSAWLYGGLSLDDDPAFTEAESLALYGLPLSDPRTERLADGQMYVVQWFERARFELHPELPWPNRVLRGLLGRELAPIAAAPPGTPWADPAAPLLPAMAVAPAPVPAAPSRMSIEAIGMSASLLPVGVNDSGQFVVPDHDVGWYQYSAAPGQGENIVLWGHVLPFLYAPSIPAPFARLKELTPGAVVTIFDSAGQPHEYVVTAQIMATPEEVGYVFAQGREMLTMVSCIGEGVYAGGEVVDYSHRLITIAEPR
jgi:hypothetical protein